MSTIITWPDGSSREASFDEACDVAQRVVDACGRDDANGYAFTLRGRSVTPAEMVAERAARIARAIERKERTHRRVRVLYGSSVACYVTKWVRK